jgi:hypothetical protein
MNLVCATALSVLFCATANAQTYYDFAGTVVQGVVPVPYAYIPLPPGQHNMALSAATALTIPPTARYATVCASGAMVKYTTDGITTPTSTLGQPLIAGQCVALSGAALLTTFRAASANGTLDVEYFK